MFSEPTPVLVNVCYSEPRTHPLPGFTAQNNYTLSYTLIQGYNDVGTLLSMTQHHGVPEGNGIIGFTRGKGALSTEMLKLDEKVTHDETLYVVVV